MDVTYRTDYASEGVQSDFAKLVIRCFQAKVLDFHGVSSVVCQRAFVKANVAEAKEATPSYEGAESDEPGEIVEPDDVFEDGNEGCNL